MGDNGFGGKGHVHIMCLTIHMNNNHYHNSKQVLYITEFNGLFQIFHWFSLSFARIQSYLPTFESAVGGDDPPYWIAVGGHSVRRPYPHTFVHFLTILKHICLIHSILNERKIRHWHQDCLYLYKDKEIYMYLVLFVVLLDLQQGLIVLKSSSFSIICNLWVMGVKIFVWGVLRGVMACGGWLAHYLF